MGLVGCHRGASETVERPAPELAEPDSAELHSARDTVILQLYRYCRSFGESRTEARARLGPPVSTEAAATPNRHIPAIDSVIQLRYPAIELTYYWVSADSSELLMETTLRRDGPLPGEIHLHRTRLDDLLGRLGPPAALDSLADTTRASYERPIEGADEFVKFYAVDDTLRAVRCALYVD